MASSPQTQDLKSLLGSLPPTYQSQHEDARDLRATTRERLRDDAGIPLLVVLDDCPSGTQTVHDTYVLASWSVETLAAEFERTPAGGGFFVLTNSRALHAPQARALIREICLNLKQAAEKTGKLFEVVLRGDSTLRGHFPDEPDVVDETLGKADAWLLVPFFLQGGRYTIDDIHYVAEKDKLVPAGMTALARDKTFGYSSSNLKDYVVEKSGGRIAREHVVSLSLNVIRSGGPKEVCNALMNATNQTVVVVNAAAEEDLDVVVVGVLEAAAQGKRLLYRTGAAFVSARLALNQIAPIPWSRLKQGSSAGGLIIAGSYVPKTTTQLDRLIASAGNSLGVITLDVTALLASQERREQVVAAAAGRADKAVANGGDILVMTSRQLVHGADGKESLDIGATVARSLVSFMQMLQSRPRYIIAKGGITSSDAATKGLGMRRALIVGQASPGVPLWRCDEATCKFPGLPFVVFPGNVGGEEGVAELVKGWGA